MFIDVGNMEIKLAAIILLLGKYCDMVVILLNIFILGMGHIAVFAI